MNTKGRETRNQYWMWGRIYPAADLDNSRNTSCSRVRWSVQPFSRHAHVASEVSRSHSIAPTRCNVTSLLSGARENASIGKRTSVVQGKSVTVRVEYGVCS